MNGCRTPGTSGNLRRLLPSSKVNSAPAPNRVKPGKFTRRRFLAAALLLTPPLAVGDAEWLEPTWLKVRRIQLGTDKPTHRFVHFTDVHHKGDTAYLRRVVREINAQSPDFVCFTGDIIEERRFSKEALELLAGIKSPVYGVPGNHDYWGRLPFDQTGKSFQASGGAWLLDQQVITADGKFCISGETCLGFKRAPLRPEPKTRNILLMHYPAWVKKLGAQYDLILAGHSHGGQVRLPFYGPVYLPFGVDEYDLGLFRTARGPLYVNPGIGWFPWPIRFRCRPELTVFEI